jgi:phosphoglycerol transferase MdoB-like AlkP superfamily enzyme
MNAKTQNKIAGSICVLFLILTFISVIISFTPQLLGLMFYTITQSILLWIVTFALLTITCMYAEAWFSSNRHYYDDDYKDRLGGH